MGEFLLKLLDWPFLLFAGLGFVFYKYTEEIGELIKRGGVSVIWGDKSFSIAELPDQLDENFAPLSDDVNDLKDRIEALEQQVLALADEAGVEPPPGVAHADAGPETEDVGGEQRREDARNAMLKALDEGRYRWRSLDRLAIKAMVPVAEAQDILRGMDEVVISRGKSGRTIARLENR